MKQKIIFFSSSHVQIVYRQYIVPIIRYFLDIVMYSNIIASSEPVIVSNTFKILLKKNKYKFVQIPLEQLTERERKEQQRTILNCS